MTDRDDAADTAGSLARKAAIGAVGGVVTAAGVVMLVTPGPGLLVTAAGLGILSGEFPAAQRVLDRVRRRDTERPDAQD